MWRLALIGIGGWIGYRLAKTGKSHMNMIIATLSALVVYKLTQSRMTSESAENPISTMAVREMDSSVEKEFAEAKPVEAEEI